VPHSGDPSSGYAAFRMTCWGDTIMIKFGYSLMPSSPKGPTKKLILRLFDFRAMIWTHIFV